MTDHQIDHTPQTSKVKKRRTEEPDIEMMDEKTPIFDRLLTAVTALHINNLAADEVTTVLLDKLSETRASSIIKDTESLTLYIQEASTSLLLEKYSRDPVGHLKTQLLHRFHPSLVPKYEALFSIYDNSTLTEILSSNRLDILIEEFKKDLSILLVSQTNIRDA
jgi:hypothetical protein